LQGPAAPAAAMDSLPSEVAPAVTRAAATALATAAPAAAAPARATDSQVVERLHQILRSCDLETTNRRQLRQLIAADPITSLASRKTIDDEVDKFLNYDGRADVLGKRKHRSYGGPCVVGKCTPLWLEARAACTAYGDLAVVEALLAEVGADVDAVGRDRGGAQCTALKWAVMAFVNDRPDALTLVMLLLEKGADVNAVGRLWCITESTPLGMAAMMVRGGIIDKERSGDDKLLLSQGMELVRVLLAKGARLADSGGEGELQPHVDSILGAWVCRPHARNEHFELMQHAGRPIECCVCLDEVARREELVLGACGHKMCIKCYARMVMGRGKDRCPQCRVGVREVITWGFPESDSDSDGDEEEEEEDEDEEDEEESEDDEDDAGALFEAEEARLRKAELEAETLDLIEPSYEWQNVNGRTILRGMETKVYLDGRSAVTRIPPQWSMRVSVPDHAIPQVPVTRSTTLREVREALQAWGRDNPRDYVSHDLYADEVLITAEDDDLATVESLQLFGKKMSGGPRPKSSTDEFKTNVNSRIPMSVDQFKSVFNSRIPMMRVVDPGADDGGTEPEPPKSVDEFKTIVNSRIPLAAPAAAAGRDPAASASSAAAAPAASGALTLL